MLVEIPDMEAFQKFMQTEEAADVMKSDGVRADTLLIIEKASDRM
jgi:hypothetical protein